ncbi:hypothetical protein Hanom_Chr16g01465091 [Helianthus anomalus]
MNQEEKPMYMEEDKSGKMTTLPKKPDEELWYHRIVKNFVLPRDNDLSAQPAAGAEKTHAHNYCCAEEE